MRQYVGCSKSIHTTVVIPTTVTLQQGWTNHLQSNTSVTRSTYSSGFAIAQNACGSEFLISTEVATSNFVLWFPHRQIFSCSGRFLFWEVKKSHTVQVRENMQVAAGVGFRV
jgi:hypothetical protein